MDLSIVDTRREERRTSNDGIKDNQVVFLVHFVFLFVFVERKDEEEEEKKKTTMKS